MGEIQVVPADSSQPVGKFTAYSKELIALSCESNDDTENTLIQADVSSKNRFAAVWKPVVEGKHEVHVSVIRTSMDKTGYRNNAKVYDFTVSSSFVTSLFASLMILCLNLY